MLTFSALKQLGLFTELDVQVSLGFVVTCPVRGAHFLF